MESNEILTAQETLLDTPPYYEVYADRWCICSGHDWFASIIACSDAVQLYGAALVERYVDGHQYARFITRQTE